MKIPMIPFPYSVVALAVFIYVLVLNQIFLGSPFLTFLIAILSFPPLYSIQRLYVGIKDENEGERLAEGAGDENEKLCRIVAESKEAINNLWGKSSRVKLGTEAQMFSLEETTTSIKGISDSIHKTVEMIEKLSPSADKASQSVVRLVDSIGAIGEHNRDVLRVLEKAIQDIKEMNSSVNVINDNFENLTTSSQQSSKKIEEISKFSKNIEKSATDSFKMSKDVAKEAEYGVNSVLKTIESMENIKSIVSESSAVIKTLGDRSGEIGNIVKLIDNITTRINLLSLNASIIASQAGEHGKPFAVVASEMEKLASQTSSSTVEISQLIDAIQDMVQSTVQANEVGMWGVEDGVSLANKAGEILKKIKVSSGASVEMSKSILSGTKEQAEMAADLLAAIEEEKKNLEISERSISEHIKINKSVKGSTVVLIDLSKEVAEAIERQQNSSQDISEVINEVVAMISDLTGLTKQQDSDSEQIKQATEIINFISKENINAIKDLADAVEEMKSRIDETSKPYIDNDEAEASKTALPSQD